MKWLDPLVVFGLIVVLLSIVIPLSQPILTGLDGYEINPYVILINGFIAVGLAISIFLIERQRVKRKEKFGRLFILGQLDSLIHALKLITGELMVAQTGGTSKMVTDSYTNVDTFKLINKFRVFHELNRFKDVLPVFSDVVDFNEWYPLHNEITRWILSHNKQIKFSIENGERYRIMEKDEDYKTMKKVFRKHYTHWEKYKPNNYDMNFVTSPKYSNYPV